MRCILADLTPLAQSFLRTSHSHLCIPPTPLPANHPPWTVLTCKRADIVSTNTTTVPVVRPTAPLFSAAPEPSSCEAGGSTCPNTDIPLLLALSLATPGRAWDASAVECWKEHGVKREQREGET
ncbi:hypothetical protein HMN09_00052400 [Mycena chlorophos]|uniref:Uncharacterized protein n=1 Tax=Mycena chlorophos TaxID=658473 RepID=A0A8H6TVY5_MYCCL|nr:hypothetical protein HMN09_00052400 [Mycena chlorophos]